MFRLIACDMDGTLLQNDQTISKRTISIIHTLQKNGIEFMLVSGRDRVMAGEVLKQHGIFCDMILNNGNEFLSLDGSKHLTVGMDHTVLKELYQLLTDYEYHASYFTTNGKYTNLDLDEYYDRHVEMAKRFHGDQIPETVKNSVLFRKEFFLKDTHQLYAIEDLFQQGIEVMKIDAKHFDKKKSEECLNKIKAMPHLDLSSSYNDNFEICADTSNKGKMLERICESKGYQKEEVLVLGDSHNDISMFEMFPYCVAPENACKEIKDLAYRMTSDNNHDGVANALETLIH